MKPSGLRPEANTTLLQFLKKIAGAGVKVAVVGHSLGGAMAATMALWLCDNQKMWDSEGTVEISSLATAGPTAGNSDFATYSDRVLGSRLTRVANSLDVVPQAWDPATLMQIPTIYKDGDIKEDFVTWFINVVAFVVGAAGKYKQVQSSAQPFTGVINTACKDFFSQMGFQHIPAYFQPFRYEDSWTDYTLYPKHNEITSNVPSIPRSLHHEFVLQRLGTK